eukprot:5325658-Pyramimonas_sp.AAC.1
MSAEENETFSRRSTFLPVPDSILPRAFRAPQGALVALAALPAAGDLEVSWGGLRLRAAAVA